MTEKAGSHVPDVTIVGCYPPPYGGISVHIQRLMNFLDRQDIKYLVYSHGNDVRISRPAGRVIGIGRKYRWWISFLIRAVMGKNSRVVHFHYFPYLPYIYGLLYSRLVGNSRVIITIHDETLLKIGRLRRRLWLLCLRATRYSTLITVSRSMCVLLNERSIRALHLPAYVPPVGIEVKKLEPRGPGKKLFAVNVFKLNNDRLRVYGLDLAVRLLGEIKAQYELVLFVATRKDYDPSGWEELLRRYDVGDSVRIMFEELMIDYMENFDFLLRPNREDGYGVSVQEALSVGVNAIASDACARAKGTILFKSGDFESLRETVSAFINKSDTEKRRIVQRAERPDFHQTLIGLYKDNVADS